MSNIVGQGYDGAAAMSGQHNGVQQFVKDKYPTATYVHCISQCLNLCLEKAAKVVELAACLATMRDIINFFRELNKRSEYLLWKILTNSTLEIAHTADQ